ncbi:uncharacterized protein LACBIDRAFT_324272 [Laccaria bicolor S238N-H82]|uniref:Predicted protein n=1 Tax=Laccaria bicolor (strain S238N-H82 / ATCC MYA-4686) TaxID=486041 RepID=B0D1A5_LACBS|nr:uncharacterized protein LACBIDRAFT_324272 [Laccaria bicolor S238N-H82]EDR11969.1 predicted protein [Laccaria bicolor S238N-H82]|eukprot:XP_001877866.1 predicted protein [Laccaria bicolor S238N-H82]
MPPRQTHLRKTTRVHEDPPEPIITFCGFCQKGPFPSLAGLKRHINNTPNCHHARQAEFGQYAASIWDDIPAPPAGEQVAESSGTNNEGAPTPAEHPVEDEPEVVFQLDQDLDNMDDFVLEPPEPHVPDALPRRSERVTVEEVPDEDNPLHDNVRYVEDFPKAAKAGATWGIRREQETEGDPIWGPFADEAEWQLAQWLLQNVGQKQVDAYLKLPIMCDRMQPSYKNNRDFLKKLDALPTRRDLWTCEIITAPGNCINDDGKPMPAEKLELWHQNPVEVVKDLMSNESL